MTDIEYRNQGLSRFLMEKIFEEWNSKCDLIYLYANKSALSLYSKFGFTPIKEYEYFKLLNNISRKGNYEKLDISQQTNRELFYDYVKNKPALAKIFLKENVDLLMFNCISFFKDAIYYINSLDIIAVANFTSDKLHLFDIFGKKKIDLEDVIQNLINLETKEVVLGFAPEDSKGYEVREIAGNDTLFIQPQKINLFMENKLMFPILSHA